MSSLEVLWLVAIFLFSLAGVIALCCALVEWIRRAHGVRSTPFEPLELPPAPPIGAVASRARTRAKVAPTVPELDPLAHNYGGFVTVANEKGRWTYVVTFKARSDEAARELGAVFGATGVWRIGSAAVRTCFGFAFHNGVLRRIGSAPH